jgi:hypothetical protein
MSVNGNGAASRIRENKHFGAALRKRLLARHENGAVRAMLDQMSDSALIESWLANEARKRDYLAERAAKGISR